ncbi:MAG TPA: hypothetical protein VLW85_17970 [Myxococcales bacterium]|nr:hypothetical protein [Myxococcales bacterium]
MSWLFDRRKLAVLLLLLAGAAKAQEVACRAVLAGTRALVDATIHGLLDRDLLRVVKLGIAGRLTVQTSVVRKRQLWFGRVVAVTTRELPLTWSEERAAFELDGRALADPDLVPLERIALPVGEADDPRAYEVEVTTRLVVVTPNSLGRVADLLAGESESPLAKTLLGAIASDLTRTAAGSCPVQPRR